MLEELWHEPLTLEAAVIGLGWFSGWEVCREEKVLLLLLPGVVVGLLAVR